MKKSVVICTFLLLSSCVVCVEEFDFVSEIIRYISNDLKSSHLTLVTYCDSKSGAFSTFSTHLLNQFLINFTTKVVNISSILEPKHSEGDAKWQIMIPTRSTVIPIIFETQDKDDLFYANIVYIFESLELYIYNGIRPQILLMVITDRSHERVIKPIQKFFRKRHFYDVTIIEIVQKRNKVNRQIVSLNVIDKKPLVKVYRSNPFNGTNFNESFTKSIELFPDWTKNIYGYEIKVIEGLDSFGWSGMNESVKAMKQKDWDNGYLAAKTKIFCQYINCTIREIKFRGPLNAHELLFDNNVDFLAFTEKNIKYLDYLPMTDFYQNSFDMPRLMISQVGYYEFVAHWELGILIAVVVFIIAIFVNLKRLFRLDSLFWSPFNVTIIVLLGHNALGIPRRTVDKILYLILILLAVTLVSDLLMQIFEANYSIKKYDDFRRNEDVLGSRFTLKTTPALKQSFLDYSNDSNVYLELFKKVKVPSIVNGMNSNPNYILSLMEENKINLVSGIQTPLQVVKYAIENSTSDYKVDIIPEPLDPSQAWIAHAFARTSVLIKKFNFVLRKMFESGIDDYCYRMKHLDYLYDENSPLLIYGKFIRETEMPDYLAELVSPKSTSKIPKVAEVDDSYLCTRIMIFFLIGYLLTFAVFIAEKMYVRKRKNHRKKSRKTRRTRARKLAWVS